jgi:hypothetical protein
MEKGTLTELLAEATGRRGKGGSFEFAEQEKASVLVSTGGPMLAIEDVTRVDMKDGYALVKSGKADVFAIELERIIGLRTRRSKREGAGFVV